MPTYTYSCVACDNRWDAIRSIAQRDECPPCSGCESVETIRQGVYAVNFNLPGDDWASKNGRITQQMTEKNARLDKKQVERSRDAPGLALAPNVEGERTDSWAEAKRLATSKGLNGESYDGMIKREESLK